MNMYLFHYYERKQGPFRTLSDLSNEEAIKAHAIIDAENSVYAKRNQDGQYIFQRRIVEERAYSMFIRKGGKPQRKHPYYMILEHEELIECKKWFNNSAFVQISIKEFDKNTISFTYGDSFPTFKPIFDEQPEYNLYLYNEIFDVISKRGMPPPRNENMSWLEPSYIEAQIWSEETINKYRL